MRKFIFTITFCLLLVLALSCRGEPLAQSAPVHPRGTAKDSSSEENEGQTWEYNGIPVLAGGCQSTDFPVANYTSPPDGSFRSMSSGTVADGSFKQGEFDIFGNRLIIRTETNYVLYNENRESTYYVMVFDFKKSVSDGMIVKQGDIIGHAERDKAKLLVFSETLDPYLVINSNSRPAYYAGYFWFDPVFLSPTGSTKWITFDPVDNIENELSEMAGHLTEEKPGLAVYNKRVRFRTKLSQYPREISQEERKSISTYEMIAYGRNGLMSHVTEINAGSYDYLLCWQNGFSDYLKKEYALNDDIWLYGVIVTYNVWEKKGYVFLRDFTPVSVEEMYEGRLRILKGS